MMIAIVVLVLSLLFGFLCYMSARTWKVPQVVLLFFVFLLSLVFMILASATLKTHQGWKSKYRDLTAQLEREQKRLDLLEHGDLLVPDDETESLPRVANELARLIVDRGRVWRNVKPQPAEGGYGLNMTGWGDAPCLNAGIQNEEEIIEPVPDGDPAQPAGPASDHGITPGMVVFGFLELSSKGLAAGEPAALFGEESELLAADTQGLCRVPGFYAGSFRVDQVEGNSLIVLPTLPLDEDQRNAIESGQYTWALYEVMPVDSHEIMAGMSPEAIQALFGGDAEASRDYVRDMTAAQQGDPDSRTMRKIRFLRDHEILVDVEGEEFGIDKNFSPNGRAILSHLRQGEPTKFKAGDVPEVFFPTQVANELRRDGICEFVDEQPRYVRPLRDYRYYFYQKDRQIEQLQQLMENLKRENLAIADTEKKARDQQKYREEELVKLQQDKSKTGVEVSLLSSYLISLKKEFETQKSRLSSLYQWNNQQADELRGLRVYRAGNP